MQTIIIGRTVLLACIVVSSACAGGNPGLSAASTAARDATTGRRHDVISVAELSAGGTGSTLDRVRRLRPEWFASGLSHPGGRLPVLYVDGARQGDLALLADIRAEMIAEIRYVRASEAKTRYGMHDDQGVVLVRLQW